MKKLTTLFLVAFLFSVTALYAQAENETTVEVFETTEVVNGEVVTTVTTVTTTETVTAAAAPRRDCRMDAGKWSIYARGMLTLFDGDATHPHNQIFAEGRFRFGFDAGITLSFNPIWGLSLEYAFMPFGAEATNLHFSATSHAPALMLNANLSNLFYSHRNVARRNSELRRWNIIADFGFGVTFFDSESTHVGTPGVSPGRIEDGRAGFLMVGVNTELNLSRRLALTWSNRYRMHDRDNLEAASAIRGNQNDGIFTSSLGLRWKFIGNNENHMKNVDYATWAGFGCLFAGDAAAVEQAARRAVAEAMEDAEARECCARVEQETEQLRNQLNELHRLLQEQGVPVNGAGAGQQRAAGNCADFLSNLCACLANICGGAGQQAWQQQPGQQAWQQQPGQQPGQQQPGQQQPGQQQPEQQQPFRPGDGAPIFQANGDVALETARGIPSVFFEFDRFNLDARSRDIIRDVAAIMHSNPDIRVEIRAYADHTGSVAHNARLTNRRAAEVKRELVSVHGVDAARITANGRGKILEPVGRFPLNRRADFLFSR